MEDEAENRAGARRERRIERKRLEIMNAAARVFVARGYAGTTTRDIAAEADLGESTLYSYFASKREILLAIADSQAETVDTIIASSLLRDEPTLVTVLDRALEATLANPLFTRALLAEAWVSDEILQGFLESRLKLLASRLAEQVSEGVAAGKLRPVDPRLTARLVIGMALTAILPALRGAEPPPTPGQRHALAEAVISVLLDGIRANPRTDLSPGYSPKKIRREQPSIPRPLPPGIWRKGSKFLSFFDGNAVEKGQKSSPPALEGGGRGVGEEDPA